MSTVGYGDYSPTTVPGRLFILVAIMISIGIIQHDIMRSGLCPVLSRPTVGESVEMAHIDTP